MEHAENQGQPSRADGPLVLLSGTGASPHLLAQALRGAGDDVARRLVVLAPGEGPEALGRALTGARLIFVSADH